MFRAYRREWSKESVEGQWLLMPRVLAHAVLMVIAWSNTHRAARAPPRLGQSSGGTHYPGPSAFQAGLVASPDRAVARPPRVNAGTRGCWRVHPCSVPGLLTKWETRRFPNLMRDTVSDWLLSGCCLSSGRSSLLPGAPLLRAMKARS
jgi:hypothetical protein